MPSLEEQLKLIAKQIQPQVNKALKDYVAPKIKDIEREKVQEQVYDVYDPVEYERREENGGLIDQRNMIEKTTNNADGSVTLSIENDTMSNEDYLPDGKALFEIAGVVENGNGYGGDIYDYGNGHMPYDKPRPFTEETQKAIENNSDIVEAFKEGLNANGLKTV